MARWRWEPRRGQFSNHAALFWGCIFKSLILVFKRKKTPQNPQKTPQVAQRKASITEDLQGHTSGTYPYRKTFWALLAPLLTNSFNAQMYLRRLQLPWAKLQEGDGFLSTSASNKCLVVIKDHVAKRLQNGIITTSSGPWSMGLIWTGRGNVQLHRLGTDNELWSEEQILLHVSMPVS